MNLNPTIITEPARKLVGLEYIGRPGGPEIPALWHSFAPRMGEITRASGAFGASHFAKGDDAEAIAYLAAREVHDFGVMPEGMKGWEIEGGLYAVVLCPSLEVIHETIMAFYDEWLPGSKYEAHAGLLEVYPSTFPEDPRFDLRFSVKLRS